MKRYQPKKVKNPVKAIREMCIECMGGRGVGQNCSKLISECPSVDCALHDFRFGKNPFRAGPTEKQKESARRNISGVRLNSQAVNEIL